MKLPRIAHKLIALGSVFCSTTLATAQVLEVSLTASDHNGYHISCFGGRDGAIDATITGGTPPYDISWSNSATTEDIAQLASGLYIITVTDGVTGQATAEITLTEPTELRVGAMPFTYPSGLNISCYECYNGSIDVTVTDGVAPYTYDWGDGVETQDRAALGAMTYVVKVTDENGCVANSNSMFLTQPERTDWTMEGNMNTDDEVHYFGTRDEQDVVFKSNGAERLRLKSGGDISLLGNAAIGKGFLYLDGDGILKGGPYPYLDPLPNGGCFPLTTFPYWETRGNDFDELCGNEQPRLGTRNAYALKFITDDVERMIILPDGRIGVGTVPTGFPGTYKLFVEGGIATRDVLVKLGDWPDYVFKEDYHLLSLAELKDYLRANKHLPGIPSAAEVDAKGGVEVGDLQKRMLETIEQQALYILQLEEKYGRLEQRIKDLEASK